METTTMTMSCQGSAWRCHCSTDLGGGGDGGQDLLGCLFGDRHSSDDLFELVWQGGVPEPERLPPAPPPAPSEAEMASWLFPIVCGEEFAGGRRRACADDDDQMVPSPSGKESDHKLQEKMKTSSTGGRRSHRQAEAHSLTEKRRRCKIKEKLKTLQQLVPGCHNNSNQASTLDQTIRYMKSLQEHIQAMSSSRCGMKPTSVAVYPLCYYWWDMGAHQCREMTLGQSPPIVPFCGHVSMGSPSPYPECSHDV